MRPSLILLAPVLLSFFSFAQNALGQKLSVGLIAGGSLTDSFQSDSAPAGPIAILHYSPSKDYAIGVIVELRILPHWSLEVDGMYRKLHLTTAALLSNGSLNSVSPSPVITWEFPVLAKYRLGLLPKLNPFAELGPSFRTAGNLNGANPSHRGVTAGIGLETHVRRVNISPVLRYTRWAEDRAFFGAKSRPDQLELLVSFSVSPESQWRPFGRRVAVGLLAGVDLTDGLRPQTLTFVGFASSYHPIRTFISGPAVELAIMKSLSFETEAVYHRFRSQGTETFNGKTSPLITSGIATWEIPLLAKYKLSTPFVNPFVEAGPSLRLPSSNLSHYGFAAGLGVESHLRLLKIAPLLRYTHWARDSPFASAPTFPNQVEFLVRFTL